MDAFPEYSSVLPRFNSEVCKWHLFNSNLTEDVFQALSDTFTMDYQQTLKFQNIPEERTLSPNKQLNQSKSLFLKLMKLLKVVAVTYCSQ